MPLGLLDQYDVAVNGITTDDISLLERVLTQPDSVTSSDTRTVAEKLGFKDRFLKSAVNIISDPTVLVGLYLSRHFPTGQFLRGVIPQRFVGAANEFSGLSAFGRTVEGFFRGTTVPRLVALSMRRRAEVTGVGNKIFDLLESRPLWDKEMPVVTALLEGQNPAGATPELRNLSVRIREHMEELWGFLSRTHQVSGGLEGTEFTRASSRPFTAKEAPRHLRDFLPHIPLFGNDSLITIDPKDALKKFSRGKFAQAIKLAGEDPNRVWTVDQSGRLASDFTRYRAFQNRVGAKVFNPRLFRRKRFDVNLSSSEAGELFETDLNIILQKYVDSVARTYALNAPLTAKERALASVVTETGRKFPSSEPIAVQVINEGLNVVAGGEGNFIQKTVAGTNRTITVPRPGAVNGVAQGALTTLLTELQGKAGLDEVLFGNLLSSIRFKASRALNTVLGKKRLNELEGAISAAERGLRDRRIGNGIASYFYATTLGLNPLSAIKNLLQPFLTTAPSIGIGSTLEGFRVLKSRLPRYADEFITQHRKLKASGFGPNFASRINLAQEKAFNSVFPELAEAGIQFDPRAFEINEAALLRGKFSSADAYFKVLLQPFTQTELSNQVVSFFGAKQSIKRAIRGGQFPDVPKIPVGGGFRDLSTLEFDQFLNTEAASIVNATQFRPGPGSKTILQSAIPAPFRMFTSFPIRLGNFFVESTVRGALTDSQLRNAGLLQRLIGGRNLGTLARTFTLGRILDVGFRDALGVDLSDALGIVGPFTNIANSGQLFAPLPIPPLPSVAFGIASYTASRDIKDLQPLRLPVVGEIRLPKALFPGGIAISRAVQAVQQFRPDRGGFVDDDERLMFRGDTTDMVLAALGIPLEKQRRSRQAVERVNANRRLIRQFRRRFAVATLNFDTAQQTALQLEFSKAFPDFPPLAISRQDLRRYQESANKTSLQRAIGTLGRAGSFLEQDILSVDPDLIADPTQGLGGLP